NINSQRKLIEDEEQQRLLTLNAAFQNTVEDREQMAVALATAFAEMSTVQQAFAEHNREALIAMLHSSYLQLDEKYGIPQSQFHLAPATSFLRLHKLEKFDDDLSAFRNTVLAANRELTPISGLEKGKGGYGVRGVVPVFYAGVHVGSFEMGMNFDEGLLLAFQAAYGPDVSVYFREDLSKVDSFEEEEGIGTDEVILYPLYATTMEEPVEIDEQTKSIVFENDQPVTVRLEHGGIAFAIIIAPVHDYTGDVVGVVEIGIPRTVVLEQMAHNRNSAIITGVVSLLVILILVQQITYRTVLRPIIQLEGVAEKVARGDMDVEIDEGQRSDEIGKLTDAFCHIRQYIQDMAEAANFIANGDLLQDVTPHSKDDLLGNSFQKMIVSLRKTIGGVMDTADGVRVSSTGLQVASDQSSQATSQIATTIQQVASGTFQQTESVTKTAVIVDQMGRSIEGVANGAQEQSQAINQTSEITAQMMNAIQEVSDNAQKSLDGVTAAAETSRAGARIVEDNIKGMAEIKSKVDLSSHKVIVMGERSGQIGAIVETINDIASQTNLLALNAAIEAARAGEHGKGFAVVADEVRKLAERTVSATREISDLVNEVQDSVSEAVAVMEESANEVDTGTTLVNSAGDALASILTAVEDSKGQVESITTAAYEMKSSSEELVSAMDSVSAVIEENTAATEEMAAGSIEVNEAFGNIASVSEENSAAVEEVTAATEEMHAQVQEVSAASEDLAEMVDTLATIVASFQLPGERAFEQKIELFRSAHLQWVDKLEKMIAGRTNLNETNIADHHSCVLGAWYYGPGSAGMRDFAEFGKLEAPHIKLHMQVKEAVAAYNRGDKQYAESVAREVEGLSHEVVDLLDQVETHGLVLIKQASANGNGKVT
ncbi:MAG: CZB domain-containing protein, partial [Phycisphaerae bacterium]|nr:CZB domain-containing protein [Phycisphaerae bacterium]